MQRRTFTKWLAAAGLARLAGIADATAAEPVAEPGAATAASADQQHLDAMQKYASLVEGPKLTIGMLVYPGMFLQDLVGPLAVFEALMNKDIHLLWKTRDTVGGDPPGTPVLIPVQPTTTFAECPQELDVLFVPGGVPGTFSMMEDEEVLGFLRRQAASARYVTSVCTGSLILGAAGLLNGYRATSYWATHDVLCEMGAIPVKGRVVEDRNRITGGGVTAGLDFGLTLAARLRSPEYAQAIQLYLEYDPAPPFQAGSPDKAPERVRQFLDDMYAGLRDTAFNLARKARARNVVG